MNIVQFAMAVLSKNNSQYRQTAIANLKHGLKHESKWDDRHRKEVKILVDFLESDSIDIIDLEKKYYTS